MFEYAANDIGRSGVPPRQASGWHITRLLRTVATSTNKSHGRIEKRILTLMSDDDEFVNWPLLAN